MESDQKHFPAVLVMEAPKELRRLARDGLHEIAARELKARGRGRTTVFYQLGPAALSREVAGGGPGDHLRDRDVYAAWSWARSGGWRWRR